MSYNNNGMNGDAPGNVWSSGSHGGSGFRSGFPNSSGDNDGQRSGGSYRGSFGNNNSRRGGYGFRRQNGPGGGDVLQLTDAIFIQNLPKDITRDQLFDIFSTVGPIKTDDRSGGPKIWIYKDRMTGEANGRATVTYEDDETANKAISKFNDQHIDSIDAVVHVQLAQRRERTDGNNDRSGRGGYRGARSHWDNPRSRPNFSSGDRRGGFGSGFSDDRNDGYRGGMGGGSDSFQASGDHSGAYGSRSGPYRGASRGNGGSSNYAPY